jgi:hypothetical protein
VAIAEIAATVVTAATAGNQRSFLSDFSAPGVASCFLFSDGCCSLAARPAVCANARAWSSPGHVFATFSALTGLKQRVRKFLFPVVFAVSWREYRELPTAPLRRF